jgi:hypothetical protein
VRVLVVLLLGAFAIGGTRLGRWVRVHPPVLIVLAILAAACYYSLRVIQ